MRALTLPLILSSTGLPLILVWVRKPHPYGLPN